MSTLKIRLFGQMEIVLGEVSLARFPTRKSRALFSFLALHSQRLYPREVLANVFWPESPATSARKRLRTELWLTRKFLDEAGAGEDVLTVFDDSVGLGPDVDVWVDVAQFESRTAAVEGRGGALTPEECRRLGQAVELYRGDLLEGIYEDWCLEARERLKSRLLSALERLMLYHQARREWSPAIARGSEILRREPLAEHVHRGLMKCHFEMGNRAAALRQYRRCAELLMAELDVEPMHETSTLYQEIKSYRGPALPTGGVGYALSASST